MGLLVKGPISAYSELMGCQVELDDTLEYIKELEARLQKLPLSPLIFDRCHLSDEQLHFYTKFPSMEVFRIFWESIYPSASRLTYWTKAQGIGLDAVPTPSSPRKQALMDEFFMYCCCVALGLKEMMIADTFKVSISTVRRVTITWANYLYFVFSSVPIWIPREKVQSSMPEKFKQNCPNVRVILDCTEIPCESFTSLTLLSETSSSYNNTMTFKGLIGAAPCGLITFISALYTGSISDREITRRSGILDLLQSGDDVMADKGFMVEDMLVDVGARLIIPSFKPSAKFTKKEMVQTQLRLRIMIEQVIRRVKEFHIWDCPVPLSLSGSVNQMWYNCCFMSNYQGQYS